MFAATQSPARLHTLCWMTVRSCSFIETRGSIISKQSNVNQDHSIHEGLHVKVCWGCFKVKLSSAKAKIQSWRKASFIDDLRDAGVVNSMENWSTYKSTNTKLILSTISESSWQTLSFISRQSFITVTSQTVFFTNISV